jgi:hypothetical protein
VPIKSLILNNNSEPDESIAKAPSHALLIIESLGIVIGALITGDITFPHIIPQAAFYSLIP